MTDADPDAGRDLDEVCLAHVLDPSKVPAPKLPMAPMLAAAIRALALRVAPPARSELIEHLARYRAEKGDVVIAYAPGSLSQGQTADLYAALHAAFPSNRVLLSSGGIGLEVIQADEAPPT